jgi:hypothetical protein
MKHDKDNFIRNEVSPKLSTGIEKTNIFVKNKIISQTKNIYYNTSNKFLLNPTKYTQGGIDFIESYLPYSTPAPTKWGATGFGASKVYEYLKDKSNENSNK